MSQSKCKYKRVLLKISGESLCQVGGYGVDIEQVDTICHQIKEIFDMGVQVCLVVGGGNITRGSSLSKMGINRSIADYMGMLATVINGLALKDSLGRMGLHSRVMSAIDVRGVAEPYIYGRAIRHLEKQRIVIFVAGTGNTHFSTDTAAAVRAVEMKTDILMKATKVDGVYDADPKTHPNAKRFDTLTYLDVLNRDLGVMDSTAASLCKDNKMPIMVFDFQTQGNLKRAVCGEPVGTLIQSA